MPRHKHKYIHKEQSLHMLRMSVCFTSDMLHLFVLMWKSEEKKVLISATDTSSTVTQTHPYVRTPAHRKKVRMNNHSKKNISL